MSCRIQTLKNIFYVWKKKDLKNRIKQTDSVEKGGNVQQNKNKNKKNTEKNIHISGNFTIVAAYSTFHAVCVFFPASLFSIFNSYIGFFFFRALCSFLLTVQCWQMNSDGAYIIVLLLFYMPTSHGKRKTLSHLTCGVHTMTDLSFHVICMCVCVCL